MDKEKLNDLLNKLIDRSDRYNEDAHNRKDDYDVSFYEGQKKAFEEIRNLIK